MVVVVAVLVVVGVVVAVVMVSGGGGGDSSAGGSSSVVVSSRSVVGPEGTLTVPMSENPVSVDQLWNPKSLPDSVAASMQFETPAELCDAQPPVAVSCQWGTPLWTSGTYGGHVISARSSFDQMLASPKYYGISETTVGGKRAIFLHIKGYEFSEECNVAWGTSTGLIIVGIGSDDDDSRVDNCGLAKRWAEQVRALAPA
ncbi:hypothetical protein QSJ18_07225 [Gordonia sp. ABSL1-1]|uniref:DUF3558 family protein n=1 Tax=Gordonia sp. ABSL1-1 TaxID=3053923 RepID=UPI002573B843|nr:hypothetical protein [Gordonia sp. ABSL1-1]MDL9936529.1 hypothetical protein [Gordonia sp. ABSL1-1]